MYVKLMSSEDKADASCAKSYTLIECSNVAFSRKDIGVEVTRKVPVVMIDGLEIQAEGNVYVLNDDGKTIDSFSYINC